MSKQAENTLNRTRTLEEVDGVQIISIIDNSVDFLSTIERGDVQQVQKWVKEQKGEKWAKEHFRLPLAEHGFSMLVRVFDRGGSRSILFDAGGSPEGVVINADRMGVDLREIECVVISHGHYDHFGGLPAISRVVSKDGLPIIVHEDMFKKRGFANPDGTIRKHSEFPKENQVSPARYIKTKQPYLIVNDTALITGEIPRKTEFEKGLPQHRVFADGKWQVDPWVWDDRAIVINLRQKGLVVISGCAHAGIINTALYAQQITGVTDVYAIIGGFHLAGKESEPRIIQTTEQLRLIAPKLVAPSHCTGWRGIHSIAEALPLAFVWNSVGNLYRF